MVPEPLVNVGVRGVHYHSRNQDLEMVWPRGRGVERRVSILQSLCQPVNGGISFVLLESRVLRDVSRLKILDRYAERMLSFCLSKHAYFLERRNVLSEVEGTVNC